MKQAKKLKIGELVFLKNVGYPYNRTDDGMDSWEGVSCTVVGLDVGPRKMIEVSPVLINNRLDKMDVLC